MTNEYFINWPEEIMLINKSTTSWMNLVIKGSSIDTGGDAEANLELVTLQAAQ